MPTQEYLELLKNRIRIFQEPTKEENPCPFPLLSEAQWQALEMWLEANFSSVVPSPTTTHLEFVIAAAKHEVVAAILARKNEEEKRNG